jgi:putative Mg2+ transporter-C (MgtC) family protein
MPVTASLAERMPVCAIGTAMPLTVTWPDLAVRLACALIAGALIGYDRGEHGKAAGLRTTILVSLAASIAMLQVNYLLSLSGRSPDSFVMNDLMRLPLGILTGVGFIGAGAILRRREIVVGVTTAATLWYVTVVGLCFGGGQLLLGAVATAVGVLVLWGLKWLEAGLVVEHEARLSVTVEGAGPSESEIRTRLRENAITVVDISVTTSERLREYSLSVRELRRPRDVAIPPVVEQLRREPGVRTVQWRRFR